jgi:phage shock protein PspC (stress-responsive transcriptional regulator)
MSTDPTDPDDPTRPPSDDAPAHDPATGEAPTREAAAPSPDDASPADGPGEPGDAGGAGDAEEPPPGLYRSAGDRMLFGVCGGIAERYGFEPLLVRLAFVASLFVGGAGVLFYLAAALLIPPAPSVVVPGRRPGPAVGAANGILRVLVVLAAGIGVLAALGAVAGVSLGLTALFGAWPVAACLLVVGVLLVVWSRSRAATGSLLVLALALAVPATAATLTDLRVDRTFGDRTVRPATLARASQGYRLGVGHLTVDLRDLPLQDGDRVRIPARVDAGRLAVLLPQRGCVAWTVRVRLTAGDTEVLSSLSSADLVGHVDQTIEIDPPRDARDRRPRVTLDLRGRAGEIVVGRTRAALRMTGEGGGGVTERGDADPYDDTLRTTACRARDRQRERARG